MRFTVALRISCSIRFENWLKLVCCSVVKMAVSMCRGKVLSSRWPKVGRYQCISVSRASDCLIAIPSTNDKQYFTLKTREFSEGAIGILALCKTNHIGSCFPIKTARRYHIYNSNRNYSDDREPPKRNLPPIMDFPEVVWPSIIKTVRNWILANFIITPYFDKEFSLQQFVSGSKQALEYVSGCLSRGEYVDLQEVMTKDALEEVKKNISGFTVHQRQELALCKEDIYFCFPYQIGIMFSNDEQNQQRYVEITMCFHVLKGLKDLTQPVPLNIGMLPEYRDKIYICNYRFIREFTKGVEDSWKVNIVNHFKPSDFVR